MHWAACFFCEHFGKSLWHTGHFTSLDLELVDNGMHCFCLYLSSCDILVTFGLVASFFVTPAPLFQVCLVFAMLSFLLLLFLYLAVGCCCCWWWWCCIGTVEVIRQSRLALAVDWLTNRLTRAMDPRQKFKLPWLAVWSFRN
jgi:hypothetical protein